jgi:hypothetical protein
MNTQNGAIDPSTAGAPKAPLTPFQPLGFRGDIYYFYERTTDRVISFKISRLKSPYLYQLANLKYWESHYSTDDRRCWDGIKWSAVACDLIDISHKKGRFQGVVPIGRHNTNSTNKGKKPLGAAGGQL